MLFMVVMATAASVVANLDPAWIALLGAMFGGAGLKVTEAWLGRNRVKIDDASQIRDELRTEITGLREENAQLESSRNEWREKYYSTMEKLIKMRGFIMGKGFDPPDDASPDDTNVV